MNDEQRLFIRDYLVQNMMQDSCVVMRFRDNVTPSQDVSNIYGGITGGTSGSTGSIYEDQEAVPCRLQLGQALPNYGDVNEQILERGAGDLVLPFGTVVSANDKVRITTETGGVFTFEVDINKIRTEGLTQVVGLLKV